MSFDISHGNMVANVSITLSHEEKEKSAFATCVVHRTSAFRTASAGPD
jgi:hypothetical protein